MPRIALALVAALAFTSVAVAAPTGGTWKGGKMSFAVSENGKRIESFSYQCERTSAVARPFEDGEGPKIRANGKFRFKGKAVRIRLGIPSGNVKGVLFKGRFTSDNKAKGRFKAGDCGGRWTAKPE